MQELCALHVLHVCALHVLQLFHVCSCEEGVSCRGELLLVASEEGKCDVVLLTA